jgi:hypothetical protein
MRRRTGPVGRWRRRAACRCARCSGFGRRTACSRTGCGVSSCRRIRPLPPSCATSTGSISTHRPTASCCRSTRSRKSKRSIARSRVGQSKRTGAGTMTHDYIRHGTITLFAALNVFEGRVIDRCMARHRHQEFIRFLNRIEAAVPAGKLIHAILDNYAVHNHRKSARRARPPSALDPSFHSNPPALAARRLPLAGRPASCDQPLSRRAQPQTQTVPVDRRPRL